MFATDPLWLCVGGLLAGVAFGVLLQKGQVAKYATIVGQFLLVDWTVAQVMGTAIVTGAIGVYAMLALGMIDHLQVKPAFLLANALGGLVFGAGMTTVGYCPGTGMAAVAEGSRHARWAALGMVTGAGLYTAVYPALTHTMLFAVGDLGKVTVPDVTGVPVVVYLAVLAIGALAGAFALQHLKRAAP
jgi:hypothetical protein